MAKDVEYHFIHLIYNFYILCRNGFSAHFVIFSLFIYLFLLLSVELCIYSAYWHVARIVVCKYVLSVCSLLSHPCNRVFRRAEVSNYVEVYFSHFFPLWIILSVSSLKILWF